MAKYRAQILLEPEQHQALVELAERQNRSVSDLVREAVAEYVVEQTSQTRRAAILAALDEADKLREEIRATSGDFPEDFLSQIRDEWEDELWARVLGNDETSH